MEVNSWFPERHPSSLIPGSAPAESSLASPPPLPPDPPDPSPSPSLSDFPPLSPASSLPYSTEISPLVSSSEVSRQLHCSSKATTRTTQLVTQSSDPQLPQISLAQPQITVEVNPSTVHPLYSTVPSHSSEIGHSNRIHLSPPPLSVNLAPNLIPQPQTRLTNTTKPKPVPDSTPLSQSYPPPANSKPPTLADKIRKTVNKSLSRLAPPGGLTPASPKLVIPDSVFQTGAQLHQNFIVGKFLGRPPPFTHIQNVLSSMWSKGPKLEIHLNSLAKSMLIRIPNDHLRQKILEKKVWHITESMFYVYPWCSGHLDSLDLGAIPIWAHLKGVPLELMHSDGWSLLAGQIGEPIEVDDFTINLVSIDTAHVKVEANLTQALPPEVEYAREDGLVHKVHVHYPWVPPICSHCKDLGHIQRYCHRLPFNPPKPTKKSPEPCSLTSTPSPSSSTHPSSLPIPSTIPITSISSPPPIAYVPQLSHHSPPTTPTTVSPSLSNSLPPSAPPIPSPSPITPTLSCPPSTLSHPYSILASLPPNMIISSSSKLPFLPSSLPFFPISQSMPSPSPPSPAPSTFSHSHPDSPPLSGVNLP